MMLLAVVLLARVLVIRRRDSAHIGRTTGEVDIDAPSVILSSILQTHFTTDPFNSGLDFLDVVGRVNSLADNAVSRAQVLSVNPFPSFRAYKKPARRGEGGQQQHTHEDGSGHVPWRT